MQKMNTKKKKWNQEVDNIPEVSEQSDEETSFTLSKETDSNNNRNIIENTNADDSTRDKETKMTKTDSNDINDIIKNINADDSTRDKETKMTKTDSNDINDIIENTNADDCTQDNVATDVPTDIEGTSTDCGTVIINKASDDNFIIDEEESTTKDTILVNKTTDSDAINDGDICDTGTLNDTVIANKSVTDVTSTNKPISCEQKNDDVIDDGTQASASNDTVVINIAGELFETYTKTLERFPKTLLGNVNARENFRNQEGELFFNRSIDAFEAILYYYQSEGTVYYPELLPLDRFIDEIIFFKLGSDVVERLEVEQGIKETDTYDLPDIFILQEIWKIVEYPESNRAAKVFAFSSLAVILLSTLLFILESLPEFSDPTIYHSNRTAPINKTLSSSNTSMMNNEASVTVIRNKHADWLLSLNSAIIIWFTSELLVRFIACPNKLHFWSSFGNLVDLFVVLPYYVEQSSGRSLGFVRAIRVLRVLKLSRHSAGMQLIGRTIAATYRDLFLAGFLMAILALIYSSMVYYAEYQTPNSVFISIPHTAWWSIVTLTTVGYGDMAPTTVLGKIVGGLSLLSGILMLSLPLPAVVSNFTHFLNVEKLRRQVQRQKEKIKSEEHKRNRGERNSGPYKILMELRSRVTHYLRRKTPSLPQQPPWEAPHPPSPKSKKKRTAKMGRREVYNVEIATIS